MFAPYMDDGIGANAYPPKGFAITFGAVYFADGAFDGIGVKTRLH